MSRLDLTTSARVAHVSVARAARFQVTAELSATGDYDLTRARAGGFRHAGFDGIRCALRFTPGAARGLALFGAAGPSDPPWPGDPDPEPMDRLATMGIDAVPVPRSTAITLVEPPT